MLTNIQVSPVYLDGEFVGFNAFCGSINAVAPTYARAYNKLARLLDDAGEADMQADALWRELMRMAVRAPNGHGVN